MDLIPTIDKGCNKGVKFRLVEASEDLQVLPEIIAEPWKLLGPS